MFTFDAKINDEKNLLQHDTAYITHECRARQWESVYEKLYIYLSLKA